MSALLVREVRGLVTVQDAGRPGRMHEGIPAGGALVPELLARANAAVDNAGGEAALEIVGTVTLEAVGPSRIADDRGRGEVLADGQRVTWRSEGARVRYGAVRGGIDVPVVLGGRGTLLGAAFGGHEGRALRVDDRLAVGRAPELRVDGTAPLDLESPLRVVPGPDLDVLGEGALAELLAAEFTVDARSDRVGLRLTGRRVTPARPGDRGPSAPMLRGAIQLPPDGGPIVLGPDHPTTGGYPVVATVIQADRGRLFARPLGAPVRFVTTALRSRAHTPSD